MSMLTVDLARTLLGLKRRVAPRVDWDKLQADYVRRCRALAVAAAGVRPSGSDTLAQRSGEAHA